MKRLVGFVSVLLVFVATSGRTDEYVVARIECPASVEAKINWNDKIGEHPTFHLENGTEKLTFGFVEMHRNGQYLQCIYKENLFYQYTVKRKIISCLQSGPRILECKLVP